jgi:hypothetical protein
MDKKTMYLLAVAAGALAVGYFVGKNNTFGWNNGTGALIAEQAMKKGALRVPTGATNISCRVVGNADKKYRICNYMLDGAKHTLVENI